MSQRRLETDRKYRDVWRGSRETIGQQGGNDEYDEIKDAAFSVSRNKSGNGEGHHWSRSRSRSSLLGSDANLRPLLRLNAWDTTLAQWA